MIAVLLVFSSGIHVLVHHCLVENETEIVFNAERISCDHHETTEKSSCCNHHEHDCCKAQESEHRCNHLHSATANSEKPLDKISFSPITCEVVSLDLILDKNNISNSPSFDLEQDFSLLITNTLCENLLNDTHSHKDILLSKFLYPDNQPLLFTGIEIVYLFNCPKIPHNYYC